MKPFQLSQHLTRSAANVLDYGSPETPAEMTAALLAALAASDIVYAPGGVYDPVVIALSDKRLIMGEGVTFRLPDGTVSAIAVTGPSVFHVSGNDVTIEGDFVVDGNKANNSSAAFPTSVRVGSVYVTGHRVRFNGRVHVKDAYWMGFAAELPGQIIEEIGGLYVHRLLVSNADYHSVLLWSVKDWRIDEIEATSDGVFGPLTGGPATKDPRIRLGTELGSPIAKCRRGSIGLINSDRFVTLTVENGADQIQIDTANTAAGGKIQNVSNVHIGLWNAYDASVKNQAYGLALISVDSCSIGTAVVQGYDCVDTGFVGYSFAVQGVAYSKIGAILVAGTKATAAGSWDMIVTTVQGLDIDSVMLIRSGTGTQGGFFLDYDAGFAPQQDMTISSMISRGHVGYDLVLENKTPLRIGSLNSDAVEQYPQARTNMATVRKGTWTPTITRSGSTVTATGDGRYEVIGNTVRAHFSLNVTSIGAQGTGYWAISLPLAARGSYVNQAGELMLRPAVAGAVGCYASSGNAFVYLINAAGNDAFNAALATGAVAGSITYEVD